MTESSHALSIGTRLAEFEISGLVGEGGFGIVYLAKDHLLERQVALKEFMPSALARRGSGVDVEVRSPRMRDTFDAALRSFVNEARLLAQFDHPALVKVFRFWEANGTAYMVMPYYRGPTLREALRQPGGPPSEQWLRDLLAPLLDALDQLHAANCFHRDIAPDNILILETGRPLLLDFGAARKVISDVTQDLTVILKPGFAPIEQYVNGPDMRQGPWTDVYALAAVVHYCVTGRTPPPSVSRMMNDTLEPLTPDGPAALSAPFCAAIRHALAVRIEDRIASMADFRRELGFADVVPTTLWTPAAAPVSPGLVPTDTSPGAPLIPGDPFDVTQAAWKPPVSASGAGAASIGNDWDATTIAPARGAPPSMPPRFAGAAPLSTPAGMPPPPAGNDLGGPLFGDGPMPDAGLRTPAAPPPSIPRSGQPAPVDLSAGSGRSWGAAIGAAVAVVGIVVASAWWFGGGGTPSTGGTKQATLRGDVKDSGGSKTGDAADKGAPATREQGRTDGGVVTEDRGPRVTPPTGGTAPPPTLEVAPPPVTQDVPPPIGPAYSPDAVIDALASAGDPGWQVGVQLERDAVRIGKDRLRFSITSSQPGFVYLLMAGTDRSHFHLLFPNSLDRNNRIGPDKPLALPRANWAMVADGPEGTDRFLAIVSAAPRDFSAAGLRTVEPFAEFERTIAEGVFGSQGPMVFAGRVATCAPGDVQCARFGARSFEIREIR